MFTLVDLVQPETLEDAYQSLISKRSNTVLGGCAFLKLGSKRIMTGIDLSKLNLNYIREQHGFIEIGAMTTFRDVETSSLLKESFNGILPQAVSQIIGVQFRNVVTVGASVFSKYGFSDLITALLVLDTEVELYHDGRMSLQEFLNQPPKKDILTKVFIKNDQRIASCQSLRNSASDFPILNAAVSQADGRWTIAVGARPLKAELALQASELLSQANVLNDETIEDAAKAASEELTFGTNVRGSAEYRQAMSKVLVQRGITEVLAC
ncbi:FAD binding domain-containing protein [Paradesulfitobacterium ferrireducens]|uniref:FAD binding domain-containing protein n=1 Tax=Paradesulfitobacterium ferrireducens TaxID=2816476 RepID=UPI001A8FD440|nr:FAD binding domain-containing protein [Paradesulfitobacterium ferrireducens]